MASLTNTKIKDTYDGLLKTTDNDALGGTYKLITDGLGNSSNVYLGTGGRLGIGASSPSNGKLQIDSTGNQISIETGTSGDGRLHIGHFSNGTFIGTYGDDGGAADIIRFGTHSGDERMRIDSSGDLTINGGRLFIKESDLGNTALSLTRDADEGYLQIYSSGTQTVEIRGNGDSYLNGGNVGIGTSSPSGGKLHIYATNTPTKFESSTTTLYNTYTNSNGNFGFLGTGSGVASGGSANDFGIQAVNNFVFATGGSTERLRIDSSGNVGIGTSSPTADLSVGSTSTSSGDVHLRTTKTTFSMTPSNTDAGGMFLDVGWASGGQGPFRFGIGGSEKMRIDSSGNVALYETLQFFDDSSTPSASSFIHRPSSNTLALGTNSSERFRIDSSGNILINNTSTYGDKLVVKSGNYDGTVGAAAIRVYTGSGTGSGTYHGAVAFSAGTGAAAISAVQTGTDSDQIGLSFWTHESATSTDASVERLRIDSSGNVSIKAPTASGGGVLNLENTETSVNGQDWGSLNFVSNDSSTGASGIRASVVGTSTSFNGDGNLVFSTAPASGSNTERMRIDSSGNVGIGGTADSDYRIHLYKSTNSEMAFESTGTNGGFYRIGTGHDASGFGGAFRIYDMNAGAERMRITSGGNVEVGSSSNAKFVIYPSGDGAAAPFVRWNKTDTASQTAVQFLVSGAVSGSITYSSTATAYNTSSDYRLKENVVDLTGALDRVDQLEPKRFNFIADEDTTVDGFLAHEVQDIVPEAVTGEKDATEEYEVSPEVLDDEGNVVEEAVMGTRDVYQGIDQSKLVPLLVGAIKELKAEIETLKSQINS